MDIRIWSVSGICRTPIPGSPKWGELSHRRTEFTGRLIATGTLTSLENAAALAKTLIPHSEITAITCLGRLEDGETDGTFEVVEVPNYPTTSDL